MNRRSFLGLLGGLGAASATSYFFAPIGGWKSDVIAEPKWHVLETAPGEFTSFIGSPSEVKIWYTHPENLKFLRRACGVGEPPRLDRNLSILPGGPSKGDFILSDPYAQNDARLRNLAEDPVVTRERGTNFLLQMDVRDRIAWPDLLTGGISHT